MSAEDFPSVTAYLRWVMKEKGIKETKTTMSRLMSRYKKQGIRDIDGLTAPAKSTSQAATKRRKQAGKSFEIHLPGSKQF